MMAMSEINEGDTFSDPKRRELGALSGLEWVVIEKDEKENMIRVQAMSTIDGSPFRQPIWKKISDSMFCESWRVYTQQQCS